jgi:hypothetical protein
VNDSGEAIHTEWVSTGFFFLVHIRIWGMGSSVNPCSIDGIRIYAQVDG